MQLKKKMIKSMLCIMELELFIKIVIFVFIFLNLFKPVVTFAGLLLFKFPESFITRGENKLFIPREAFEIQSY